MLNLNNFRNTLGINHLNIPIIRCKDLAIIANEEEILKKIMNMKYEN